MVFKKHIDQDFFKEWNSEMAYVLGYIVADGCISVSKDRKKHPFTLNITSSDKKHLYKIRKAIKSEHKVSIKLSGTSKNSAYQLQIRNPIITHDLISLGVCPRKTYNLGSIEVPKEYFPDFVRGFFDGDGSVYIYNVNDTPQIKASFVSSSPPFITHFNKQLCATLNISLKTIQNPKDERRNFPLYRICFYIDDCEKLAKFMYGNDPELYLFRKHQIFEKWKSIKRRHYIKQNYPSKVGWYLNQKNYEKNETSFGSAFFV